MTKFLNEYYQISVNSVRCSLLHVLNFVLSLVFPYISSCNFSKDLLSVFISQICPAFLFSAIYRCIFMHVIFSVFTTRLTTLSKSAVQTTHFPLIATYLFIHKVFAINIDKKPTCSIQIQWTFLFLVPPGNVHKIKYQWLNNIHLLKIILNKTKIRRIFIYTHVFCYRLHLIYFK